MSETTATVPMDDNALFEAAMDDAPPAAEMPVAEAAPEAEQQADAGPPRDEQGRFAPKTIEQPEVAAEPVKTEAPAQNNADVIPPWRLREEAEARRSAESRASQLENQLRQLSGRLQQLEKPEEPIDPYVDPEKFRDAGVRQAVDPIAKRLQDNREFTSRRFAEIEHGKQTVKDAWGWLQQATNSGDPKAGPILQRVMNSDDPFQDLVEAFTNDKAISTVGKDPNAWFEKELERRKAEDPAFVAKHLTPAPQNGASNIVKLPPSLNRQPGTAGNASPGTFDDKDLYANAIR
jgi:hypothetical protein